MLIFPDQMSVPSSPSPTCSLLCVLICTFIQAPLGKANFIKVVSWIKDEGVYFALWSAVPTSDRGSDWTMDPCEREMWPTPTKPALILSSTYSDLSPEFCKREEKIEENTANVTVLHTTVWYCTSLWSESLTPPSSTHEIPMELKNLMHISVCAIVMRGTQHTVLS